MQRYRSALAALTIAAALAGRVLVGAGQSENRLPLEPVGRSGGSVTPAFEGWYQNPDGSFNLLLGYFNRNQAQTLDIPVGPNNRIEPGDPDRGQPTHFLPNRQWGVFTITVPKDFGTSRLTWTIVANGQTMAIPFGVIPLYDVEPLRDAAMGNTPPLLRFDPQGPAHTGPPRGITASLTATVREPATLVVWLAHQPGWKAELAGAAGTGALRRNVPDLTLTWSKYRGPGDVKFSEVKPAIDKANGRAATTATFSHAGDYILRAQVNDPSGDGGAGFQCCWTNALVKVTVKPGRE